ncbi:hypothetical protein MMC08_008153 [Hypocenomyce scalaris]|nr:hypothetical protein [Hypocenomyce scalaris]
MSQPDLSHSFTPTYHKKPYATISPTLPALSAAGKIVVVTGGSQGIGLAITDAFAAAGASHIAILARNATSLADTKSTIEKDHPSTTVHTYPTSITEADKVASAFKDIRSSIGEPDILVLCAGVASNSPSLPVQFQEVWYNFEVNVKGNLIVVHEFLLPDNPKQGKVLINISTAAIHVHLPKQSTYGASKEAFVHILACMHNEQRENGVRIVSMHPGAVLTKMARAVGMDENTPGISWDDANLPGHFAVWLASPEATFLAGRFVWANWDVGELKARAKQIGESPHLLKIGLIGEPAAARS